MLYLCARAVNGMAALATVMLLTRVMTVEAYGKYSLLLSFVVAGAAFFYQWIALAVARFLPGEVDRDKIYSAVLVFYLSASIFLFFIVLGYVFFGKEYHSSEVLCVALGILAVGLFTIKTQIENSSEKPKYYLITTCVRSVGTFLGVAALIWTSEQEPMAFMLVVAFFALLPVFIIDFPRFNIKLSELEVLKEMARYSLPLSLSVFAVLVIDVSDKWMISYMLGVKALASYAAAYDVSQQVVGTLLNIVSLVFFPALVRCKGDVDRVAHLKRNIFDSMVFIVIGCILGAGFFSGTLSFLIFGEAIADEAQVYIPWIVLAVSFGCMKTYYFDLDLKLNKCSHTLLFIALAMAAFNVLLNLLFLPVFGPLGGAYSTALAFLFGLICSACVSRKHSNTIYLGSKLLYFRLAGFVAVFALGKAFEYLYIASDFLWGRVAVILLTLLAAGTYAVCTGLVKINLVRG